MATTFLKVKNRALSTLASDITDSDLSLTVAAGEGALFPSTYPFHITIEDEILTCTNRSTDTLTVTRAAEGTSAAAHTAGKAVVLRITAQLLSDLDSAVNAIENDKDVANGYAGLDASLKVIEDPANATVTPTVSKIPIANSYGFLDDEWTGLVINVKNYGAVGDGSTDDTDAINAAIAAANDGDMVFFPKGTYNISSTLTISKPIVLQGILSPISFVGSIIYKTGNFEGIVLATSGVVIRDMGLDGVGTSVDTKCGIYTTHKCILDNVAVHNQGAQGIYLSQSTTGDNLNESYLNIYVVNNNSVGLMIENVSGDADNVNAMTVIVPLAQGNANDGVRIATGFSDFIHIYAESNGGYGVRIGGASHFGYIWTEDNTTGGIYFYSSSVDNFIIGRFNDGILGYPEENLYYDSYADVWHNNKIDNKERLFNLLSNTGGLLLCDFQTYEMWLKLVSGGGTVTQSFGNCQVRTSTTTQSYANHYLSAPTRLYDGAYLDMRMDIRYVGTDSLSFFGAIQNDHLVDQEDHTLTTAHAGVFIDDGEVYTSTSDGTTQEITDVGSSLNFSDYKMIFSATDIKFYSGNTLLATHSTNFPTSLYGVIQMYINNKATTSDRYMYCWKIIKIASN